MLGVVPGLVGVIQAAEAIKLLLGRGDRSSAGCCSSTSCGCRSESCACRRTRNAWSAARTRRCASSSTTKRSAARPARAHDGPEVTPRELAAMLGGPAMPRLIDVREPIGVANGGHIAGAELMPLRDLPRRLDELDSREEVVCYCAIRGAQRARGEDPPRRRLLDDAQSRPAASAAGRRRDCRSNAERRRHAARPRSTDTQCADHPLRIAFVDRCARGHRRLQTAAGERRRGEGLRTDPPRLRLRSKPERPTAIESATANRPLPDAERRAARRLPAGRGVADRAARTSGSRDREPWRRLLPDDREGSRHQKFIVRARPRAHGARLAQHRPRAARAARPGRCRLVPRRIRLEREGWPRPLDAPRPAGKERRMDTLGTRVYE